MTATLKSVTKALEVLHLLRAHGPLRLTEIAAGVGVGASTAHRLVTTLVEQRFVRQQTGGKRYELGTAMLFTSEVSALEHCVAVSRTTMEQLQRTTGETVHLTVLRDRRCLFAASVESQRPVRVTSRVGEGPPAHTAAGGKVLLAALDAERLTDVFLTAGLEATTPDAITDPDALRAQLVEVAERGYARNLGESEADMYALAVPVHRPNGEVICGLTVAAPLSRIRPSGAGSPLSGLERELLAHLRVAAASIERALAY